ncbi:hypothetical protein RJT34_17186 [Clitoria ternatea]|uniref:Uncharacterized protein n=1 Tax=Clitoria ternatea TaxID=43366 RepID=A0AAN9J9R7_CLITE
MTVKHQLILSEDAGEDDRETADGERLDGAVRCDDKGRARILLCLPLSHCSSSCVPVLRQSELHPAHAKFQVQEPTLRASSDKNISRQGGEVMRTVAVIPQEYLSLTDHIMAETHQLKTTPRPYPFATFYIARQPQKLKNY